MVRLARIASHVWRNRHGTYYFRLVIPLAARSEFGGRREIRRSLRTNHLPTARQAALAAWVQILQGSNAQFGAGHDNNIHVPPKTALGQLSREDVARLLTGSGRTRLFDQDGHLDPLAATSAFTVRFHSPALGRVELEVNAADPREVALVKEILCLPPSSETVAAGPSNDRTFLTPTSSTPALTAADIVAPDRIGENSLLGDAVTRFNHERKSLVTAKRLAEHSYDEFRQFLATFVEAIGAQRPLREIDANRIADFRSVLKLLPPNRTKNPRYRGKALRDIIESQKRIDPDQRRTISDKTKDSYLSAVSTFFEWTRLGRNPIRGQFFLDRTRHSAPVDKSRKGFTVSELASIFAPENLQKVRRPHEFWIPLLGLFTGARLGQLAQLRVADVYSLAPDPHEIDKQEAWALSFNLDAPGNRAKNAASLRSVPIHPELLRIGFLQYLEDLRAGGHDRLFPYLQVGKRGWAKEPGRDFANYLDRLGIRDPSKVYHSLRHNVRTMLERNGARTSDINRFIGHASEGAGERYLDGIGARDLFRNLIPRYYFEGLSLKGLVYRRNQFDREIRHRLIRRRRRRTA